LGLPALLTGVTGKLQSVFLRAPDDEATARWREFGWREAPDPVGLLREHEELTEVLESSGADVVFGDVVPGGLDAIYTFDPALVTPQGAVLLRPGKQIRRVDTTAADMERLGLTVSARLEAPATAEGGDLLRLDERTVLLGGGYRTNAAGVAELRAALPDVEFIEFDLPHFHGPGEVMHLLSLINLVADDIALVYLPLLPVRLVQLLKERGIRLVEVPDEEFETMGPNVLALEPGVVLALRRNRETQRRLEKIGVEVRVYDGTELSKGDGGPTCLTLPLLRR
jgi:N-dimethylarginine dimethylaminohydrolase